MDVDNVIDFENVNHQPERTGDATFDMNEANSQMSAPSPAASQDGFALKKILVPIDFSESSERALQYASSFARHFDALLILMHVAEFHYGPLEGVEGIDLDYIKKRLKDEARERLTTLHLATDRRDLSCETVVRVGRPSREIVAEARKREIDLIIIATHGRSSLKHVFMGGTAENVVRLAPCPVLTVREHEHEFISC